MARRACTRCKVLESTHAIQKVNSPSIAAPTRRAKKHVWMQRGSLRLKPMAYIALRLPARFVKAAASAWSCSSREPHLSQGLTSSQSLPASQFRPCHDAHSDPRFVSLQPKCCPCTRLLDAKRICPFRVDERVLAANMVDKHYVCSAGNVHLSNPSSMIREWFRPQSLRQTRGCTCFSGAAFDARNGTPRPQLPGTPRMTASLKRR